jgi:hypothetical protein
MNIKEYDEKYSKLLRILNPYDTVLHKLDPTMPSTDGKAYKLNPSYRHLYDKLFILQSQHIQGGELIELKEKDVSFPLFIKPRYGHKTSSSKDCYKIKKREDLEPHYHKKNMIWSEFIDATEGMTDFVLVNGEIVYQLTYVYSDDQYGFADVWKYISSESQPPPEILEWVHKHLQGYTGPLNVQYRDTKIIEIGLRFARRGMYIESTQHKQLIDSINHVWKQKTWNHRETIEIQPFYSFKCWSPIPVVCLLPHHLIRMILHYYGALPYFEFYFEPVGTNSTIFFQFLHHDFDKGMKLKRTIETLLSIVNMSFLFIALVLIICTILNIKCKWLWYVWVGLFLLSMDNSLKIIMKQITNQRQFF